MSTSHPSQALLTGKAPKYIFHSPKRKNLKGPTCLSPAPRAQLARQPQGPHFSCRRPSEGSRTLVCRGLWRL